MGSYRSPTQSARWATWLWWVLTSAVGGGVGWVLGFALAGGAGDAIGQAGFDVMLCIFGASVASCQWLVLRPRIPQAGWWMAASTIGWIIVVGAYANAMESAMGHAAVRATVAGATVGAAQWLVLRRHVPFAGCWVPASAIGWGLGWAAAGAVDRTVARLVSDEIVGYALLFAIIAAVASAFTGLALAWLLRRPLSESPQLRESAA